MVEVLHFIGSEGGACFLDQSHNVMKGNHCIVGLLLILTWDLPVAYFTLKKGQCLFQSVFSFPFISSTGGSDSSMSDGLPMHLIYAPEGLKMVSLSIDKRSSRNNWPSQIDMILPLVLLFFEIK